MPTLPPAARRRPHRRRARARAARREDEVKPVAEIKNKAIEASVTIDAELKAYPELYANLVAEGKREMAKWAAEADQERKEKSRPGSPTTAAGISIGATACARSSAAMSALCGATILYRRRCASQSRHSTRCCGTHRQTSSSTSARSSAKPRKAAPPCAGWPKAIRAALAVEKKARRHHRQRSRHR